MRQVFDPHITKESQTSWVNFISGLVTEFGTFIVGGFINKMRAIVGKHELSYFWVIATVDEVIENENSIELRGQAVPFDPTRFPKVKRGNHQ